MEKISTTIEEKNIYNIEELLDNIALITSIDGKSGLLDINTNEVVGNLDNYENKYNSNTKLYYQEKEITLDTLVEVKEKTLRIYDVLENKCIADNWLIIYSSNEYELVILQDYNGKYHIFESNNYRTYKNSFNEEFDYVKILEEYSCWQRKILVKKNGKFGIYTTNSEILIEETKIIYDNIESINGILIYTLNGKKTFNVDNEQNWYDDIKFDENKNIFYGINNPNSISVYYSSIDGNKLLFTTNNYDKLKYVAKYDRKIDTFLFITKKNGKFGILSYGNKNLLTDTKICKDLLETEYDEITWSGNSFFLNKNGKIGMIKIYDSQVKFVEAKYDKIVVYENNFYALYIGNYCNIINLGSPTHILVENCNIVDSYDGTIVYEKNGMFGILSYCDYTKKKNYWNSFGYDNITRAYDKYFKIEKNKKVGIFHIYNKIIIDPIHDSIDVYQGKGRFMLDEIYFVVKDDKYKLFDCSNYNFINDIYSFNNSSYEDIILLPDIIVFKSKDLVEVYDYNKKVIGKFHKDTIIEPIVENDKIFYLVNDEYYFYKNGIFEKVHMANTKLYTTVYESKYGTIVVNNYDKKIHDRICKNIEFYSEEEIDETLLNYYDNNEKLQQEYPTLKKKRG